MVTAPSLSFDTSFPNACIERVADAWKWVHDFAMGVIESIKRCLSSSSLSGRNIQGPLNILSFYRGDEPNNNGVSLNQILGWDDSQLESVHNYVQWLFPLRTTTVHNPTAPILNPATIHAFRTDPNLKAQLLRSFRRMLAFYGLQINEATKVISRAPNFSARAAVWLINPAGHHNFLRITRIIHSMSLLGHADYSASLLRIMLDIGVYEGNTIISVDTLSHWASSPRLAS